MHNFVIRTAFLAFLFGFANLVESQYLDHGEDCELDENDLCNKEKYLHCAINKTCECYDSPNSFYDLRDLNPTCKRLVSASCNNTQPCITNSYCPVTPNAVCTCLDSFNENNVRQCFKSHENPCQIIGITPQCDPYGFLECAVESSGASLCRCLNSPNSWYNSITRTCHLTTSGAPCGVNEGSMTCVPNSECDPDLRRCKCISDLVESSTGLCYLGSDQQCNPLQDLCNSESYLTCDTNAQRCVCAPRNEAIYDNFTSSCKLLAEASCSPMTGAQPCIPTAECLQSSGAEPYRCACNNNLVTNKNRECFLDFGKPCDRVQSYCDAAGYLTCGLNNTCSCENPIAWYDYSRKECRLGTGLECTVVGEGPKCPNNAWCENGFCRCLAGYEEGQDQLCYRSWNQQCSPIDPCNNLNYLQCGISGRCECPTGYLESQSGPYSVNCLPGFAEDCATGMLDCAPEAKLRCFNGSCECLSNTTMKYEPLRKKCVALPGNKCDISDPDGCADHSHCSNSSSSCICDFGYEIKFGNICTNESSLNIFNGHLILGLLFAIMITQLKSALY